VSGIIYDYKFTRGD